LQIKSYVDNIITQNVDRLHTKSGSRGVLEIHGSLHEVQCLSCGEVMCRNVFQKLLAAYNPEVAQWSIVNPGRIGGDVASSVNPDGDVEVS
jgi:NAD-dependent deacetylase sirtuin 4